MAVHFSISIILVFISIINTVTVAIPEHEFSSMLSVLRSRGYHLFANAVTTSDIRYDIISGTNFTLFAPVDSALFSLDMTIAATDYVTILRFHVVPRRLSLADLRRLTSGTTSVPTLMPGHNIYFEQRRSPQSPISIDGVDIIVPGLFYGRDIAVHGLEGILGFRSVTSNSRSNLTDNLRSNYYGNPNFPSPIANFTNYSSQAHAPPPPPPTGNHTISFPVTGNQTVSFPVSAPTTSNASSPDAAGTSMPLDPGRYAPLNDIASAPYTREERKLRAKLTELTSRDPYELLPYTEPTGNVPDQFTVVDDTTVDCPLTGVADDERSNIADIRHGYLYERELYTASTMSCERQ